MHRGCQIIPENDDFNWVKARHECSLCSEFERLWCNVESSTKERSAAIPKDSPTRISCHSANGILQVSRHPTGDAVGKSHCVLFRLEEDHISVTGATHQNPLRLTLTLNGEGECRFKINGKGEYRRWQVTRKALESLFFDPVSLVSSA